MGIKKGMITLILIFFLMQFVFASTTEITVKSLANSDIQIVTLQEGSQPSLIKRLDVTTDKYGDAIVFFSTDEPTYRLAASVYIDGRLIMEGVAMPGLIPGEKVYLELIPEGFIPLQNPEKINIEENNINSTSELNATENLTGETITEDENDEPRFSGTTGLSIFNSENYSKIIYGIIGGLIIGFVLFMVLQKKEPKPKEIQVTKLSDLKKAQAEEKEGYSTKIEEAEKKIKEAQEEIEKLKKEKEGLKSNRQKEIEEAKREVIKAEKRLMELRSRKD